MYKTVDSAINTYIEYFKQKVARLKAYQWHPEDRVLKKNILVSILDAISRATPTTGNGNRARFTGLVRGFGGWPDHSRVSAPHIGYFLRQQALPSYSDVREFIDNIIHKNSTGELISLTRDPEFEEVKRLWPVETDPKLVGSRSLSSFTHLNLFYACRNSLVHELREPGYGMEFHGDHQEPFYHGMSTIETDNSPAERTLELVYPLGFYFQLTNNVIGNVERYLRHSQIDPYRCYQFGSSWMGELNI